MQAPNCQEHQIVKNLSRLISHCANVATFSPNPLGHVYTESFPIGMEISVKFGIGKQKCKQLIHINWIDFVGEFATLLRTSPFV